MTQTKKWAILINSLISIVLTPKFRLKIDNIFYNRDFSIYKETHACGANQNFAKKIE